MCDLKTIARNLSDPDFAARIVEQNRAKRAERKRQEERDEAAARIARAEAEVAKAAAVMAKAQADLRFAKAVLRETKKMARKAPKPVAAVQPVKRAPTLSPDIEEALRLVEAQAMKEAG